MDVDEPAETLVRSENGIVAANFDATEERIVYVDDAGAIVVRTLDSGDEVTLRGGPKTVYDAQFSPDGKRVAILPEDGVLRVWRIDRPERPEHVLPGHRGPIYSINYAPDGRIVTAGQDGTVRVWPADGGEELILTGHNGETTGAAFTSDGSMVVSTGQDGSLRAWNSRTGAQLARLASSDVALMHVDVADDGKIAYLDEDGFVRIVRCEVCGPAAQVEAIARSRGPRELTAAERARFGVAER
jgi:WD40 repeat protein